MFAELTQEELLTLNDKLWRAGARYYEEYLEPLEEPGVESEYLPNLGAMYCELLSLSSQVVAEVMWKKANAEVA